MSFHNEVDPKLIDSITDAYTQTAAWLPMSALKIHALFDEEELKKLDIFLREIKTARDDQQRKSEMIKKFSEIVLLLLRAADLIP